MLPNISHILLDAARMGNAISAAMELNPTFDSLYRGRSEESLSEVAPYLFSFGFNTGFGNWYMEHGWGNAWGVLICSSYPMEELHKHFRKFLIVGTEDDHQLYFRFYDPRVLRVFLPTCDAAQLHEFFGPIEYFIMEDEDSSLAIKYFLQNGVLHSQKIKCEDIIPGISNTAAPEQNTLEEPPAQKTSKPKWNMLE